MEDQNLGVLDEGDFYRESFCTGKADANYAPPKSIGRIVDGMDLANALHKLGFRPKTMTDRLIVFMFKHYGGWRRMHDAMTGAKYRRHYVY